MTGIAIFASGRGSNAEKILQHFAGHPEIAVKLVVSNRSTAGVSAFAKQYHVPFIALSRNQFKDKDTLMQLLTRHRVDFIVLAGFLLLIPEFLVNAYENRIMNIHPALLPDFGGKGMYGMHVHRAVRESGTGISGMTVHLVNARYDEGEILFQSAVRLDASDTPERIAEKVLKLEHKYYAKVVEDYILQFKGSPIVSAQSV